MIDSNSVGLKLGCPLLKSILLPSLSKITVRFKGILKSASFLNSQIYGRFTG